jgi:hypothetical protein
MEGHVTADKARISYDPTRHYRSVLAQQGRVTLEADTNEGSSIAGDSLRLETIDIVGPAAALKDGYLPGIGTGPGGITIAPGVFYLGGWRLTLDAAVDLSQQPDWLNQPPVSIISGNVLVALLLNEQTVCAVEDQALREVALGGPDTAARTRLMQHFLRLKLDAKTCAAGAKLVEQDLATDGVTLDSATLQIMSQARLQVGFVAGPASTDPCTPVAAGGYLGADNQLVRVTVAAYDETAKTGTLLWGWNNASILYRVAMAITGTTPDPFTLTFIGTPVDGEHAPQLGQAVEILRSEVSLGDGNFIAAPDGFVTTVAQAYNFDTGELVIADQLPPDYQSDTNPLFIRLWQAQVPFAAGQATALDDVSGITVTVTLPALPSLIALRPFWHFAVRPSTPVLVYPQRYLEAPQPPDGPRQWIADLAVMAANRSGGATLVEDCRVIYPPAAAGGQCCTLTLGPDDVAKRGGLQAVLDNLTAKNSGVSMLAGTYPLAAPLKLAAKHSGLILEACGGRVILVAKAADLSPFQAGLIQLAGASDVTLRRLTIQLPVVPLSTPAGGAQTNGTQFSVGISVLKSPGLTVENCTFQATAPSAPVLGMGLAFVGPTSGLTVRRSTFVGGAFQPGSAFYGIGVSATSDTPITSLDNAEFSGNLFQQLEGGILVYAHLGFVRCTENRVVGCPIGIFFSDTFLAATTQVARDGLAASAQSAQMAALATAINSGLQAPTLATLASTMAQAMAGTSQAQAPPTISEAARRVLLADITDRGARAWSAIAATAANEPGGGTAGNAPAASLAVGTGPVGTGPIGTGPVGTGPVGTGPVVTGPGGTTGPTAPAPTAPTDALARALDALQQISLAAELSLGDQIQPVVHICGNDVSLAPVADQQSADGPGIAVIFSPKEASGTVLITANRVLTGDARAVAGAVWYPAIAAVTGNVFAQTGGDVFGRTAIPAFEMLSNDAHVEAMANVIIGRAMITPARTAPAPSPDWSFLNAVG